MENLEKDIGGDADDAVRVVSVYQRAERREVQPAVHLDANTI